LHADSQLETAIADFARTRAPVGLGALHLKRIGSFVALTPETPRPELDTLATACVESFDVFRAPPSEEELERRRRTGLTAHQEEHLMRWGYPYVMGDFRFHVTLTGSIARNISDRLLPFFENLFASAVAETLEIDELSLFVQPAANVSFRLARRFPLSWRKSRPERL
jgi:hypothetical protein